MIITQLKSRLISGKINPWLDILRILHVYLFNRLELYDDEQNYTLHGNGIDH